MKHTNTSYNSIQSDFCKYKDESKNVKIDVLTGEIIINGSQEYLIPENKTIWKI